MKIVRILVVTSLLNCISPAMDHRNALELLKNHQRNMNRDLVTGLVIGLGVATRQLLQYTDQCDPDCPLKCYLPLLPGALMFTYNIVENFMARSK